MWSGINNDIRKQSLSHLKSALFEKKTGAVDLSTLSLILDTYKSKYY